MSLTCDKCGSGGMGERTYCGKCFDDAVKQGQYYKLTKETIEGPTFKYLDERNEAMTALRRMLDVVSGLMKNGKMVSPNEFTEAFEQGERVMSKIKGGVGRCSFDNGGPCPCPTKEAGCPPWMTCAKVQGMLDRMKLIAEDRDDMVKFKDKEIAELSQSFGNWSKIRIERDALIIDRDAAREESMRRIIEENHKMERHGIMGLSTGEALGS